MVCHVFDLIWPPGIQPPEHIQGCIYIYIYFISFSKSITLQNSLQNVESIIEVIHTQTFVGVTCNSHMEAGWQIIIFNSTCHFIMKDPVKQADSLAVYVGWSVWCYIPFSVIAGFCKPLMALPGNLRSGLMQKLQLHWSLAWTTRT